MAGVTDRPFRQLCKKLGAGLAISEVVASNSLLWGSEKTKRRANHEGETEPKSVQIMGTDPAMMAEAARYNADTGAQIIDLLFELNAARGVTLVLVTHDERIAARCGRVLRLDAGRLSGAGTDAG